VSIDLESIQVGQWNLSDAGKVRHVVRLLPDGRVKFRWRNASDMRKVAWRKEENMMPLEILASTVERPVPCDWTLATDTE
jgi:hypothetical protein